MPRKSQVIAASLLAADMADLKNEVRRFERAGGGWLHVDVMDGRFVPNLTVGIPVVAALHRHTRLPLDVHLMIVEPERYVADFVKAGAQILTIQAEATAHLFRTLQQIRAAGARPGVALNPATPLSTLEHVLGELDLVLIMTVEPGFGGQEFITGMLPKIRELARCLERRKLAVDIQVDGGIKPETIGPAARAGANVFVSGTGVFGAGDVAQAVKRLRAALGKDRGRRRAGTR
jgi:ribulose-phosphate 3-epimerase